MMLVVAWHEHSHSIIYQCICRHSCLCRSFPHFKHHTSNITEQTLSVYADARWLYAITGTCTFLIWLGDYRTLNLRTVISEVYMASSWSHISLLVNSYHVLFLLSDWPSLYLCRTSRVFPSQTCIFGELEDAILERYSLLVSMFRRYYSKWRYPVRA